MTRKKQLAAKKYQKTTEASGGAKKKPENQQENKKNEGCNCPNGCIIGERIAAGARHLPLGAIRVQCGNGDCVAMPYIHGECYHKWADVLVNVLEHDRGRARNWSRDWIEKNLWVDRSFQIIYPYCKCPTCGNYLRREVHDEAAAQAKRQQNKYQRPKAEVMVKAESIKTQTKPDMGKPTAMAPKKLYQRTPGWSATDFARRDPFKNDEIVVQRELEPASGARRKESKPKFVPVGAPGWREARGYEDEEERTKNKEKDDHVTSFIVPSAMASGSFAADLYKTVTVSAMSVPQSTADTGADDGDSELNAQQFIRQIMSIAGNFGGKMWIEDEQIVQLFSRASMELIVEITDMGGLDRWLPINSTHLTVHRNTIVITNLVNVPSHLQSLGQVNQLIEEKSGIVVCEKYDCKVFFDANSNFTDGTKSLIFGDIVSFTAELLSTPMCDCKWIITELCLLQRMDSIVPIQQNTIHPIPRDQNLHIHRDKVSNLEQKQQPPLAQERQNSRLEANSCRPPRNPPAHIMRTRPVRCSTPITSNNNSFTSQTNNQQPVISPNDIQNANHMSFSQNQNFVPKSLPMALVFPDTFAPIGSLPVYQWCPASVLSQGSNSDIQRQQNRDSNVKDVERLHGNDTSVLQQMLGSNFNNNDHQNGHLIHRSDVPKVRKPCPTGQELREKMAAHLEFNWKNDQNYDTKSDQLEQLFNSINI